MNNNNQLEAINRIQAEAINLENSIYDENNLFLGKNINADTLKTAIRINAGGGTYTDKNGNVWAADKYFNGGKLASTNGAIANTQDDPLYQTERWLKDLSYNIPLANGEYIVKLKFAEFWAKSPKIRVFDVSAEGKKLLNDFDIYAEAGGKNIALDHSFKVKVTDNELNLDFNAEKNNGKLSALEIISVDSATPQDNTQAVVMEEAVVMGEIGHFTNFDHNRKTIQFANNYIDPVVFALPLSHNGGHPATVRITDIQSDSFSVYLQEPDYLAGKHLKEEFSYLVLEAGTWKLADGTVFEVRTVDTNLTTLSGWETVSFDHNFENTPVILSQVQTDNDKSFVRTRQKDSDSKGFALALEEEEALAHTGHGTETIGWLAIKSGAGTWGNLSYQAGHTGKEITHRWHDIDFGHFDSTPNFLASLASINDPDAAGIRYQNLSSDGVQITIEEDWSLDSERQHAREVVDFLAIEGMGNLTAYPTNSQSLSNSSQIIEIGFENHVAGTKYNKSAQSQDWEVIGSKESWMNQALITDSEAHSGNQSLRITYQPDEISGGSAVWNLPSENEYYLSYWVKFEDDFDFDGPKKSGGKLPGLGARDEAGDLCSGGQTCTGDNGFSSRYMWNKNGKAILYLYHMDKPGKYGEGFSFEGSDGSEKYFQRGKWHNLIQRVKINDGNQSNGEIDVWMDREPVLSIDKLKFVTNNQGIDSLYFSTFHGGNNSDWLPEREVYSYWDNFLVSTNAADVGL